MSDSPSGLEQAPAVLKTCAMALKSCLSATQKDSKFLVPYEAMDRSDDDTKDTVLTHLQDMMCTLAHQFPSALSLEEMICVLQTFDSNLDDMFVLAYLGFKELKDNKGSRNKIYKSLATDVKAAWAWSLRQLRNGTKSHCSELKAFKEKMIKFVVQVNMAKKGAK
eukprot:1628596-Karenia_brevis.AAC.1